MNLTRSLCGLALATSTYLVSTSVLAICDSGFTTDSGSFALESVEDFENTSYPAGTLFGTNNAYSSPVAPTLDLAGIEVLEDPADYAINFRIVDNCGAAIPMETTFVENFAGIVVRPKGSVSKLGLNYAHQDLGYGATVTVTDSNGALHTCEPVATAVVAQCSSWDGSYTYPSTGKGGFIGFDTNDGTISIVSMKVSQPDGGIDNVRCLGCDGVVVSQCNAESLREDIEALDLSKGLENSLLAKLKAATATKNSGVTTATAGVYGALINQLQAKSPIPILDEEAEPLITCIEDLIQELAN